MCIVASGVWVCVLPGAAVLSTHHRRHLGFRQFGGELCRCGCRSGGPGCQAVLVPPQGLAGLGCLGNIVTEFWRSFSRVGPLSAGLGGQGGGGGRESSSLADYWDGVTAREEGAE